MKKLFILYFVFISFLYLDIEKIFALQIRNVNASASNNNDRWTEVFNDGADILDFTITDFKILDSKDSTKHGITTLLGDSTFPANTSVIISPSVNIPAGYAKVFRSNYTIDKASGYVSLINSDGSSSYSCFSYGGVSCPSVNQINNNTNNSTSTNQTSTSTSQTLNTANTSTNVVYVYVPTNNQNKYGDIIVLLPEDKIIPAGADTEFNVKVTDQDKKPISGLDFEWSFGDGGEKFGQKVSHHYTYPGEYTLVASADGYTVGGEAKMNVKVVVPNISITKVGIDEKENFVDLTNNTEYDLVLSNFYLALDNNFYKLPKNFTILKNKTVHVSGEALGFKLPATNISLNYPNKNLLISFKNTFATTSLNTLQIESPNKDKVYFADEEIKSKNETLYNYKVSELKMENQNQKRNQVLENKIDNNDFVIKRLVLNQPGNRGEVLPVNKEVKNINKKGNVDTGIVDWFKSLIY